MLDHALSTQQLASLSAVSNGATMTLAAEQAGVHRNTINHWRRNLLPFQHALAHAQYDKAMLFREKAEALADLAFQTVRDILADPKAPASVRLKAALAIIATATTPPPPKKQIELDIEKIVIDRPEPEHRQPSAAAVDTPTPQTVHNSAQTPHRPENPKIGRPKIGHNDACSCGSGQKYKRCCLNKPATATAA